jgi:dUTP pyrophosphatase
MSKVRGFEVVANQHRVHKSKTPTVQWDNKIDVGGEKFYVGEIKLPTRADVGSAGYDFYCPVDARLLPAQKTIIFTDVKAYMQPDEVLELYIRSSLAVKKGLMLSNNVGIVDATYYSNGGNDGNIGIALVNTSGTAVDLKAGEKIAQGIFKKFLVADEDEVQKAERTGGFGSSGK